MAIENSTLCTADSVGISLGNHTPGVIRNEFSWIDEYIGSAEALVSAGLVRADQLPGQPGMPKSCATFYDGQRVGRGTGTNGKRDEKYMRVFARGKKFSIWKGITAELAAQREADWQKEIDAQREAAEAKQNADREAFFDKIKAQVALCFMVHTADEYRQKMIAELRSCVLRVRKGDMMPNDNHGFSMDESVADNLDDLLEQMIELISYADVMFNKKRHKELNHKYQVDLAKGDVSFQRTLDHLSRTASESTIDETA